MSKRIAVYPGSFDPITNGHLDIILRGLNIFDELIVAVAHNVAKTGLFSIDERLDLIRETVKDYPQVRVDTFKGLLVDYLTRQNARIVLRGLRAVSDFENEFQLAQMNHTMNTQLETLFMMTSVSYGYLSSSIVKEVAAWGGDIDDFVPPCVKDALKTKFPDAPRID
ncbi:pantetheine-phosphate adenylyltransferase [Syntrophotalea carbinolica DSM 2380]|uniref:Phosphopantetheine adenylyltransferase n=1 Tax=Syntrophotalea carbinolica (strain DSM 2380 / NBRC 103641 / GraBd1) TaxID=338963 RepID=COAD_SYNC1|nr:pantetheine-phosphate adenylyltransferase [Syntrophotalea carbinolica]Q3A423.1 RecName: Full=Phosphopantetheine adenylyltransferase; AltName: Full=Dephospho-CoA pyrophosphorylase; AltName: Full=Pantetheine-phosphate adenylyltransferase; Short=PPAT [Syntrophotalea carbinolica DSM 2380]ABA88884.1 pantetheine-phosphate adenylyltransferase [Syntrophotalea carbinolica DSM 2380]